MLSSRKRGLSGVVVVIVLILIAIAGVSLFFIFIPDFVREEAEAADIQQSFLVTNIDIDEVEGDLISPSEINITITRGPGKEVVINFTTIETPISGDIILVSDVSGSMAGEPLEESKSAAKLFVDAILKSTGIKSQGKRIGIVSFNNTAKTDLTLSNESTSIKNSIDTWITGGGTCICCGINSAISELTNSGSKDFQTIVLMTDGEPSNNLHCNLNPTIPGIISTDKNRPMRAAIKTAMNAKALGITVNTVGFNISENQNATDTLKLIASAGGGTFNNADISQLSQVYSQVATQIIEEYAEEFDHLLVIFSNETATYEEKIYDDLPSPLEKKTYTLTILPPGSITNIKKIEIYPVVFTSSGKKITGNLLAKVEF